MNVYALIGNKNDRKIKRVGISQDIQKELEEFLRSSISSLKDKKRQEFSGQYKPEDDEVLKISDFELSFNVDFDNPANIEQLNEDDISNIQCFIFNYKEYIAFQLFDKGKIIQNSDKFLRLIYSPDTFSKFNEKGITISNVIDILYINDEKLLLFKSFHKASRIIDLSAYYREATDKEIKEFINAEVFTLASDESKILNLFDNIRMRKKLFLIVKNKMLGIIKPNLQEIISYANSLDIAIETDRGKIVFPDDKNKINDLLDFLNEDLYKSFLTGNLYEVNSKRKKDRRSSS